MGTHCWPRAPELLSKTIVAVFPNDGGSLSYQHGMKRDVCNTTLCKIAVGPQKCPSPGKSATVTISCLNNCIGTSSARMELSGASILASLFSLNLKGYPTTSPHQSFACALFRRLARRLLFLLPPPTFTTSDPFTTPHTPLLRCAL